MSEAELAMPPERIRVPAETVVLPVYVLAALNAQVPPPDLVSEVLLVALLLTMTPLIVFAPVLLPVSVSVFEPAPPAAKFPVNVSVPPPEASSTPPPVVPARLSGRLVETLAGPVYRRVPGVVRLP